MNISVNLIFAEDSVCSYTDSAEDSKKSLTKSNLVGLIIFAFIYKYRYLQVEHSSNEPQVFIIFLGKLL